MPRYTIALEYDGDYVVMETLTTNEDGGYWEERSRWLIPGTQF